MLGAKSTDIRGVRRCDPFLIKATDGRDLTHRCAKLCTRPWLWLLGKCAHIPVSPGKEIMYSFLLHEAFLPARMVERGPYEDLWHVVGGEYWLYAGERT